MEIREEVEVLRARLRSYGDIIVAQHEALVQAIDARQVSQNYALKYLGEIMTAIEQVQSVIGMCDETEEFPQHRLRPAIRIIKGFLQEIVEEHSS